MSIKIQNKRNLKACFILGLLLLLLILMLQFNNFKDFINLKNVSEQTSQNFDDEFINDVFDVNQLSVNDAKFSNDHNVIGFSLNKNCQDSFSAIKELLQQNGWSFFESGTSTCGSFFKDEGNCTWLFLNCVTLGDNTSVVITKNYKH